VGALLDALRDAGYETYLVGGCVRDLLRRETVGDFDVATAAPPERVLALFPRAIPIGLAHGTVMVPCGNGPVDVTTFRGGPRLEDDLAHRDLTVNAMAWDGRAREPVDPFGGRDDLAAGRLRAVGNARERLAEDPLRALRAARLCSQLGFAVDPELERAMAETSLEGVARERLGRELEALVLAPHVADALRLLRRTGLEAQLAPGVGEDAPDVVARLPGDRIVRLAGWLRGSPAEATLLRLRFPRALAQHTARLLTRHPLDQTLPLERPAALRRWLNRIGEQDLAWLLALRRSELAVGPGSAEVEAARARLAELEETAARLRAEGSLSLNRGQLALNGQAVMALLGTGPGPHVGRALEHLLECVLQDPSRNTPERLTELLRAWRAGPVTGEPGDDVSSGGREDA
jgi:tRNA nucleotidyltransferase (CCA-adding enzyme)